MAKDHNDVLMVEDSLDVEKTDQPERGILPACLQKYSHDELVHLEKLLVRKMDLRLLPILILMFFLNILDRNSIANARLGGLEKDLKLTPAQYQAALMVLWAGYVSMMVPSNMLLSILKPKIYLPTVVIVWGIVSGATGFVQNYHGIVVVRFLTGVVEAPYFPGCIFLLSSWYKKDELPQRIAIFYSGYTLASAFGGLIAAGVLGGMEGKGGYPAWRWLFIIEGAMTIVVALLGYVLLPNYPRTTKWLSEEEKALAEYRLSLENNGEEDEVNESIFNGLKQALLDPLVWLFVFIESTVVVGLSFTYFFPTIVKTLGFGKVETLLLTAPPFFLAFIFSLANAWHCGRVGERAYHIIFACILSMVGQIINLTVSGTGPKYFGMFAMAIGVFSAFQLILSWISANIPRPKVKRGVALALATAISNCTNIATAYLYPVWDSPRYRMGGIVLTVALASCCVASLSLRFWLKHLNRKLDYSQGHEGREGGNAKMYRHVL